MFIRLYNLIISDLENTVVYSCEVALEMMIIIIIIKDEKLDVGSCLYYRYFN